MTLNDISFEILWSVITFNFFFFFFFLHLVSSSFNYRFEPG